MVWFVSERRPVPGHRMPSPSEAATSRACKKGTTGEQSRRDWSALPDPALLSIAASLTGSLADVLAFGRVCKAWSSVARDNVGGLMSSLPPLLFRDRDADFYCPADGRSYRNAQLTASLGGAEVPVEAVGCSFGHLIVRRLDLDLYLRNFSVVNPFTGARVCQFPPNYCIVRWSMLSSPPESPDCALWTFNGYTMEFCRLGDRAWSSLASPKKLDFRTPPPAVLGGVGFLCNEGELAAFDISPRPSESAALRVVGSAADVLFDEMRLCVADGELLQIGVVSGEESNAIKGFEVYRFDFSVASWMRVDSLGDRALLWDAFGATLCEKPERWGGRGDCIYFVDMEDDMWGVFHLGGGKTDRRSLHSPHHHKFRLQSPVWILPSMC